MAAQTLRDYQARGLRQIADAFRAGARRVLFILPTGGGKTTVYSEFARRMNSPGLVLVHRRELATQGADRLREFGVPFGMILAGEPENRNARVQIASVPSLRRRAQKPPARFVIPDEAHLSTAATWDETLALYPDSLVVGFTATPWRLSGKPLSGSYDRVIVGATPRELRAQGYLCPYVGFSYKSPDLSGLRKTADDYNAHDTDAAMREPSIVANVVEKWREHASDLSTVVFAVTVEHSKQLTAEFRAAGVSAEHVDGSTPKLMRAAVLRRVASGETRVLCNVGIAIEGIDIPRLKCCVLARPTMSLTLYLQMVGRVMRPWQGVTARIHDHAFVIGQHGLPDAERDYSLHAKPEKPPSLRQCEECFALYSGEACPSCGHENAPRIVGEREIVTVDDAEMFEFGSDTAGLQDVTAPQSAAFSPEDLAPVTVRWERIGMFREGVYRGHTEVKETWGVRKLHRVVGDQRVYQLPGYAQLDRDLARVREGERVRVTFTGLRNLSGGKTAYQFRVQREV